MGLFGSKRIKVQFPEKISLEELYARIKDIHFTMGAPMYVEHGGGDVISFPELDKGNQVWIIGEKGKFNVMKSQVIAGADHGLHYHFKDYVPTPLSNEAKAFIESFDTPEDACKAFVDEVAEKIK